MKWILLTFRLILPWIVRYVIDILFLSFSILFSLFHFFCRISRFWKVDSYPDPKKINWRVTFNWYRNKLAEYVPFRNIYKSWATHDHGFRQKMVKRKHQSFSQTAIKISKKNISSYVSYFFPVSNFNFCMNISTLSLFSDFLKVSKSFSFDNFWEKDFCQIEIMIKKLVQSMIFQIVRVHVSRIFSCFSS